MRIKRFLSVCVLFVGMLYADSSLQEDINKIAKASSNTSALYAAQVPAPNNIISEKIALAAMSTGELSTTAQSIKDMLQSQNVQQLGVIGESEDMNIATIKQVINGLDKKVQATIYVIVEHNNYDELKDLAQQKGVNLVCILKNSDTQNSAK